MNSQTKEEEEKNKNTVCVYITNYIIVYPYTFLSLSLSLCVVSSVLLTTAGFPAYTQRRTRTHNMAAAAREKTIKRLSIQYKQGNVPK